MFWMRGYQRLNGSQQRSGRQRSFVSDASRFKSCTAPSYIQLSQEKKKASAVDRGRYNKQRHPQQMEYQRSTRRRRRICYSSTAAATQRQSLSPLLRAKFPTCPHFSIRTSGHVGLNTSLKRDGICEALELPELLLYSKFRIDTK